MVTIICLIHPDTRSEDLAVVVTIDVSPVAAPDKNGYRVARY